ncbi:hypothetical protein [Lysinibacillus capsici]|uniref:hypothetical protein n=1 Tax=Lysinibacillus capsici TaxID=2115968 RepID=UPI003D74C30B
MKKKIIIMYYSYLRKLAFAGPHRIHKSRDFKCPDDHKEGFEKLESIIRDGGDIKPYFNRTSSNLGKYDDLFSDWGILHFHLGSEKERNSDLVKRTGPVLFAYMDNNEVYFINVYAHGHWADVEVIQEMYNSWPSLLDKYALKGVLSVSQTPNKSELRKLRECGVNTPVQIKDREGNLLVLMAPGMGLSSARTSTSDSLMYNDAINLLGRIQLSFMSNEDEIIKEIQSTGTIVTDEIHIELVNFNTSKLYFQVKKYNFSFEIPIG